MANECSTSCQRVGPDVCDFYDTYLCLLYFIMRTHKIITIIVRNLMPKRVVCPMLLTFHLCFVIISRIYLPTNVKQTIHLLFFHSHSIFSCRKRMRISYLRSEMNAAFYMRHNAVMWLIRRVHVRNVNHCSMYATQSASNSLQFY